MGTTRRYRILAAILVALFARGSVASAPGADGDPSLGAEERQQIERSLRELKGRLETLRREGDGQPRDRRDRLADAGVFAKGIAWALEYDATFTPADRKLLRTAIERCRGRVAALEAGESPWAGRTGKVVRGFVSAVDGSIQPYAVVVPAGYDRTRRIRLDVVLHGSSKPVGMSELRFIGRFDEGDGPAADAPDRDFIELHPLGRVENGYRWAGEADVFEAIEAACRNYNVDRDRIVLRGMSMGASGTWHLGLKHPDRFVALGPYCGYVDTHEFSKTPLPNFVEVGPLPTDQEKMLHMLDSVDYAANAGVVPVVACMGEKDVFFQAHEIMGRAMAKEGLALVNLISPGTGHVQDPTTHGEQMRRIGESAAKGLDHAPEHIRFVTWTLKYSRCHWLQVLGMGEHYARAELEARVDRDGTVVVVEPRNVTRFAVLPPVAAALKTVRVGDEVVPVPGGRDRPGIVVGKREGRWAYLGGLDSLKLDGKRPGLQGPIDDAFTTPFLCVRGTGVAWDPGVQAWAEARLRRFSSEWGRYFRGELTVKDDTAVTVEDARRFNLILFGDPGSNSWIARVLPRLPIRWTREVCAIGDTKVPAAGHGLVLIQPNPLADGRYVVLNSGHTFHEKELATLNYLLFPRLGDWAVVKVPDDPSLLAAEAVVRGGFFDESWAPTRNFIRRTEMNRRTFLAGTTGAVTLATTLAASAPPRGRKRVLIPRWEPERVDDLKQAVPDVELVVAEDSLEQVRDVDAAFGFIDAAHLRAGKKLRWVQQGSAGVEGVVTIPELVERDIVLTNMQRTFAPEIADQAIAYLLAFTRGLTHFIRKPPEGAWRHPPEVAFDELQGKTMLVIALGGIGSEIARRAFGFGMRVLATDPKVIEKPLIVEELHRPAAFRRLLPRADVVASAVPLTPSSRRMIGADEFGMMKRGMILINVSRGGVIDTEALVAALDRGQVAAAGLDVTDPEPLPAGHPLWKRNVIITPHSAGQSPGGQRRAHELFRENLRRFAADEMLLNIVDKKAGY